MTVFKVPSDAVPAPPAIASARETEVETWFKEFYWQASAKSKRTLQKAVGPSEVGEACERKLWHKTHGTEPVNVAEPSHAANVGTAIHAWLESRMDALYGDTGRFVQEEPIEFMGIKGTLDLYDKLTKTVIDYKTTTKGRLSTMKKTRKIPSNYAIQTQIYAAGLVAAGYDVGDIAILFIARDGSTLDHAAFVMERDESVAVNAINRLHRIMESTVEHTSIAPSALCKTCPFYKPDSTDIETSCPGKT